MNKFRCLLAILTAAMHAGSSAAPASRQWGEPYRPQWTDERVTIAMNGRPYVARIYIPVTSRAQRLPLFVVLDGDSYFNTAVETSRALAAANEAGAAVIVGLEFAGEDKNAARIYDFTSRVPDHRLPPRLKAQKARVGGIHEFVRGLALDLLPAVGRRARIDENCRAVFGHSLAALPVLEMLRTSPATFDHYVAASPSLWWDDKLFLRAFNTVPRKRQGGHRPRLLLIAGGLEQRDAGGELGEQLKRFAIIDNSRHLYAILARPGSIADTQLQILAGETHNSVVPGAISRALRFAANCPDAGDLKRD